MFIAGLTPLDHEPDMVTITNMVDPVINQIEPYWAGKVVCTHQHLTGRLVWIGVVPFIPDMPAIRKGTGFASHSAENFCYFCSCQKLDVESLDCSLWTLWNGSDA
jgi:hypothetical protein